MDVIFLAVLLVLYLLTHVLIVGLERLRGGKQ